MMLTQTLDSGEQMNDEWVGWYEAAKLLGTHRGKVQEYAKSGVIRSKYESHKPGSKTLVALYHVGDIASEQSRLRNHPHLGCFTLCVWNHEQDEAYWSTVPEQQIRRLIFDIHPGLVTFQTTPDTREILRALVDALDLTYRVLIMARYPAHDDGRKPPFREVGYLLGVSPERARQVYHRVLRMMRHPSRFRPLKQTLRDIEYKPITF